MKEIIAITQREIKDQKSGEVRDSIDRRWFGFIEECGFIPLLLPNDVVLVKKIFAQIKVDGILLTGGGDIKSCGGKDLAREKVEDFLIDFSLKKKLPLFGVCRGMQKIQDSFKIKITETVDHVVGKQKILINGKLQEVNSFHRFGGKKNNDKEFEVFAVAKDGVIKGIKHKKHKITAIMWHPERILPYRKEDIKLFREVLK